MGAGRVLAAVGGSPLEGSGAGVADGRRADVAGGGATGRESVVGRV